MCDRLRALPPPGLGDRTETFLAGGLAAVAASRHTPGYRFWPEEPGPPRRKHMSRTLKWLVTAAVMVLFATLPTATASASATTSAVTSTYVWNGLPTWSQGYGPPRNSWLIRYGWQDTAPGSDTLRCNSASPPSLSWGKWDHPLARVYVSGAGLPLNDPILPTTHVALEFPGCGYLKFVYNPDHGRAQWGFSDLPSHEWRIQPVGVEGQHRIYNTVVDGWLRYSKDWPTLAFGFAPPASP